RRQPKQSGPWDTSAMRFGASNESWGDLLSQAHMDRSQIWVIESIGNGIGDKGVVLQSGSFYSWDCRRISVNLPTT
ncbi:hypothetical protein, partial [Azotobacter salinestris]